MESLKNFGVLQTIIDMAGFYGANSLIASTADMSRPKLDETIIFGISDLLIRNGTLSYMSENKMFSGNLGRNAYIGLVSFILTTGFDLIKSKELGKAAKDNLIKNAIGVGTNTAIDAVLPVGYN